MVSLIRLIIWTFLASTLVGCADLQWATAPPEGLIVAESAAVFRVRGDGVKRELKLPGVKSILDRQDADRLVLYRLDDNELTELPFSIREGVLRGDFIGGERYMFHVPVTRLAQTRYNLLCRLRTVSTQLTVLRPGIVPDICTVILCPATTFRADQLLTRFNELQRFPGEFPQGDLANMQLGPVGDPLGGLPGGNICDQCFGLNRDFVDVRVPLCNSRTPISPDWVPQGPAPNTLGQVENIPDRPVVGAVNAVTPHPTNADILFIGAVNGGIWRTTNAMATNPSWQKRTQSGISLSIGALEFDPTDAGNQTIVAGIGNFSSFLRLGGSTGGVLRSTNNGGIWTTLGTGDIDGLNISGIAPRGSTIVLSANQGGGGAQSGIWQSTDTGATWSRISGAAGSGLPTGQSFDLVGDPNALGTLYTNAGGAGLFRSADTGATWTRVSNAAMDALILGSNNVQIAVGNANNVFVAIARGGRLAGLFRSGNGGTTWAALDLPTIPEGGIHPGAQAGIHMSIAADPADGNVVYIGGDRQNRLGGWPNSLGATDFSGNLWRVDASLAAGNQATPITHNGTANSSSPHADSRDMDFAANGQLIEGDDGGVYRQSSPADATGDWFSLNSNLEVTELHDVAWDARRNIVIGGAQDTGTPEQQTSGNRRWVSVSTADGGDVAVDDSSSTGLSIRYSSWQNLGGFRRRTIDATNTVTSTVFPALNPTATSNALVAQFKTPIELNNTDQTRMIIGGANSVYESLDQGDTVNEIGVGITVNGLDMDPIAYGASDNPEMLYVGSGTQVFIRNAAAPAALTASAT